jgi:hypothetical protein
MPPCGHSRSYAGSGPFAKSRGAGRARDSRQSVLEAPESARGEEASSIRPRSWGPPHATDKPPKDVFAGLRSRVFFANGPEPAVDRISKKYWA